MAKIIAILLILVAAFGFAFSIRAAELYVNFDGKVKVSDAEVTYLNNNIITVTLWGTRWIFFVDVADSDVKLTNASGEPITVWQLVKGHKLYVEGVMKETGVGKIEVNVKLLRDLSLQGQGSALSAPFILGAAAAALELPRQVSALAQIAAVAPALISPLKSIARNLGRDMSGSDVRQLQEVLLGVGYIKNDEVTGYFGEATERAVKRFQKANGLAQEGTAGPLTRELVEKLRTGTKKISVNPPLPIQAQTMPPKPFVSSGLVNRLTKNLRLGMSGGEIIVLQEFLQKNNFGIPNDGPVTGFYGKVTALAVARFQEANGLEAVGDVGPLTRDFINKLLNE